VRLQKYLAHCGVASRRKSEELIQQGHVTVNGQVITEMGCKVKVGRDKVVFQGKVVLPEEEKLYIMLNKPEGVITSSNDQFNRPTVIDLVITEYRIYPVGRLDYDTSGLILLTNDGAFANQMMHPKYKIPKTYHALVKGTPTATEIQAFEKGLLVDGSYTHPARLKVLKDHRISLLEIIISEGRNRQVRKMCDAIGHPVHKLKRVTFGNLSLGSLNEGEWRYLTNNEVNKLKELSSQ
jgi:23S rRNA pseudouridine2605 synthase